jgi:hypothetical protein
MTRTRARPVIDGGIARGLRIESIADAVVAVRLILFHRLPGPVRRKCGVGFEGQDQRGRVCGFLDKRSTRVVVLAFSEFLHVTPYGWQPPADHFQ